MEKKELPLQPRLALLASLVPQGASVADVGTDHGYLPVYLLQHQRICHAIASDINREPLEHARRTALAYGVTEGITFRLCAGLTAVSEQEVDTVVIAGMGGETISSILQDAPWTREKTLLLQPMTKAELLRSWLVRNGYAIVQEHLVRDKDTLYAVITATGGESEPITPAQAYCGVKLAQDPLCGDYIDERIRKLMRASEGLTVSGLADKEQRIADLHTTIAELKKMKREWEDGNSEGN
ncbi:MAG: class I SAM-dependent methyltransferase [Eubacteriales bacterium]|nr:class I SAM-dependent methyltransferase [Eubacteriales bacterium]